MPSPDHAARVRAYTDACTSGSAQDIASHLLPEGAIHDTNHDPIHGSERIGRFFVRVRERWGGAAWTVDTLVVDGDAAAVEWSMTGRDGAREFVVTGSDHYAFRDGLIAEVRQYWTFDREAPGSTLRGHPSLP